MSTLYRKHNYTNKNIEIIRNTKIREYDIKSAGLNILYNRGYIEDNEYKILTKIDKLERNIIIGKWLRDNPEVNAVMMDEFIRIRKNFFELNELEDDDVLSIKKDAIFVVDKSLNNLEFENYKFVSKEEYTDYMYLDKKEFYYNKYDGVLEVKGLSSNSKDFQQNYYFDLVKQLFKLEKNKKEIFKLLIEFKDEFLNRRLDKEYYKDIESNSYVFKLGGIYTGMDTMPDVLVSKVCIDGNLRFINNLINIFI